MQGSAVATCKQLGSPGSTTLKIRCIIFKHPNGMKYADSKQIQCLVCSFFLLVFISNVPFLFVI